MINIELIKDLEIRNSTVSNLAFTSNTILSCFFFFFVIIDLYYLIPEVTEQIFNPIAEHVIPIEIEINEVNAEIETQTLEVTSNL